MVAGYGHFPVGPVDLMAMVATALLVEKLVLVAGVVA